MDPAEGHEQDAEASVSRIVPSNDAEAEDAAEWSTTDGKDSGDSEEEFITSLSVGDGRHLVDLGSPSEWVVDEECLLQLFRSCPSCGRQSTVHKEVRGLKLVIDQTCTFCHSHRSWTNLLDDGQDRKARRGSDAPLSD